MIRRQMVTLRGGRQVHIQRAGDGPPLIVLHQSPSSSNDMLDVVERLAANYTVFALDTPGNGLSDPLDLPLESVSMDDYSDNIVEVLDALKIPQALIYGFHTGALAAIAFSVRHPDRTPLVVANGYITMDPDSIEDIRTNYLVPFVPDWTGSHLAWWWARLRDQYIFFPFHRQTEASRSGMDIPPVDHLQWAFNEFLLAGDGYRSPYSCAFGFDGQSAVAAVRAPLVLMSDATDILYPYLDLLGPVSDQVSVHRAADPTEAEALLVKTLGQTQPLPAPPPIMPSETIPGRLRADYLQLPSGSVRVLRNDDAQGRPLLFLHDLGGSADTVARFMQPWIGHRPVIAPDLPGSGETRVCVDASLDSQLVVLEQAMAELDCAQIDVIGIGTGATVAVALAQRAPTLVQQIIAPRGFIGGEGCNVDAMIAEALPPVVPDFFGSHLPVLWTMLRHRALFRPWQDSKAANGIPGSCDISADIIQEEFTAWLKALPTLPTQARDLFSFPLDTAIAAMTTPIRCTADPLRGRAIDVVRPGIAVQPLPLEPDPLAQMLRPLIDA